ncbi:serine/arginine repetitive matrix protein 2 isoform X1 [Brienomyrus brachyistius]|uniref:serine/arginine repetitive matrix protein 2 isoform X1 n=1 Tax=Brienomyrus brachyistius TaxID=42636 RepID=UPI0020B39E59|nr:serine/arginine repetitive matrix protein 2 isoform X1 [Brienomyrus brachyistius]
MPLAGEDLYCRKFQPNIFDPSRCQTCLRLRHLHANVPQRDDSDDLSVVSSYCDISRDHLGCEEGSLCILSPDCELYICDEDDSTDSTQDPSDFPELSDSLSQEEDEFAHQDGASYPTMTRLHPAPHRPNPQAWMEEARSRDGFSRQAGAKGQKDHDSGYLSLGRAGGIHSLKEKKPPAPYRHLEIGHPLPSHRSPEPKATIPFRNPDLGVPSQRRSSETQGYDPSLENSPPSGFSESSYGWNFDSGQRSLSPTPFRQAESLESPQHRRCDSSYSRGQQSSYSSTHQQPGNLQKQGCTFSRSSSPCRSASPFRQADQSGMSSRRNFDFPQGSSQGPRTPSQNSYGRGLDIASVSKNFKSVGNSIGSYSQTDSFANLRNSLRKKDVNVSSGMRSNSRDSSPSKRGCDNPSQTLLRKTDTKTTPNSYNRDSRSSSPSRKINETPSQTLLRKTDSKLATNNYSNNSRSSSPSRKGYDTPTQSILRKTDTGNSTNTSIRDSHGSGPSRRACNTSSQTILRKSEARGTSGIQSHNSQISTPSRRVGERLKKDSNMHCNSRSLDSRGSSPSRQGHNTSNYSILRKTETKSTAGIHGHDSRSPSPSRQSHDLPRPSFPPKTRANSLSNTPAYDSRSSSPSRKVYDTNQPAPRKATDIICRPGSVSSEIKKTTSQSSPSPGSWRSSSNSLHSPPISRSSSPSRRQGQGQHISKPTFNTSEANSRGGSRNNSRQRSLEPHTPSLEHRQSFHHNPGLSPQSQQYTSSQSSLESESSHLSGGSLYVGLNKEEYALMADLPKVKTIYEREGPGQFGRSQNHILAKGELYKPASHTQTKEVYRDQAGLGERGKANGRECDQGQRHRQDREAGQLTRTQSSSSLHTQRSSSPSQEEGNHWKLQLKRSSGPSQELLPDRTAGNCRSRFPSDEAREKASIPYHTVIVLLRKRKLQ